jgi:hypothetical protein
MALVCREFAGDLLCAQLLAIHNHAQGYRQRQGKLTKEHQ